MLFLLVFSVLTRCPSVVVSLVVVAGQAGRRRAELIESATASGIGLKLSDSTVSSWWPTIGTKDFIFLIRLSTRVSGARWYIWLIVEWVPKSSVLTGVTTSEIIAICYYSLYLSRRKIFLCTSTPNIAHNSSSTVTTGPTCVSISS